MKHIVLIILTTLMFPAVGQEIKKVMFTYQKADEPPTKQGRSKYSIEFIRQDSGDLIASEFHKDKASNKLKEKLTIEKDRVKKIIEWSRSNKRIFNQTDLGVDVSTLKDHTNNYKLNFDMPDNLLVNVDSFRFCQAYKMTRTISTGGETTTVTLMYEDGQKHDFVFDSNDVGAGNFNLRDYILCYTLLADRIPDEVPGSVLFSGSNLVEVVLYYQKTVECEGYYYKEFVDKRPNMTSRDRRMMTGWNFVEYMRQRE